MEIGRGWIGLVLAAAAVLAVPATMATMVFVPVAAPGGVANPADTDPAGYGSVGYDYQIGKFEVTAGEYRDFLNAVDPTGANPNGIYNSNMDSDSTGCQITLVPGNPNGSKYDFSGRPSGNESDWVNRPVNYVSWYDAARFTNWMTTGNTETGVYTFQGGVFQDPPIGHQAAATTYGTAYFIPTEDEWYKAAYYSGAGTTYYDYPTRTDTAPSSALGTPTDPGNNATFYSGGYTIGSPYYRTEVGAHENSESPFLTFDQGGNVWEWNETVISGASRGMRGGAFNQGPDIFLRADYRYYYDVPTHEYYYFGFRVASIGIVPEPASALVLVLAAGFLSVRRRRG